MLNPKKGFFAVNVCLKAKPAKTYDTTIYSLYR